MLVNTSYLFESIIYLCTPDTIVTMTSSHQYETRSCLNSMTGAFEPVEEEELSINMVPQEKTISTNPLLDFFSRSTTTDIQPKGKRKKKVSGFKRHTVDLTMHSYYRFLRFLTTHRVTSIHELRNVINNDEKRPY